MSGRRSTNRSGGRDVGRRNRLRACGRASRCSDACGAACAALAPCRAGPPRPAAELFKTPADLTDFGLLGPFSRGCRGDCLVAALLAMTAIVLSLRAKRSNLPAALGEGGG